MQIEQFRVFLHRAIVAILRLEVEATMPQVEDGIMVDGIIRIVEEDRIVVTIVKTTREEEIISIAEEDVVGEIMAKVLLEEVTIKEVAVRTIVRVEEEVDRAIIREVIREDVITQTNKDMEAGTHTNTSKIQEVTVPNTNETKAGIIMAVAADEAGIELLYVYIIALESE